MENVVSLTEQLRSLLAGDRSAAEAVLREVLPKLHQIASQHLGRERHRAPVCATELIHEVWLRHLHRGGWTIRNREHFYAIITCAMRRVLVDFARNRLARKRGADETVTLNDSVPDPASTQDAERILEVGLLMEGLAAARPRAAEIVDLHYFAGFSLEEIAEITGLKVRQVRHQWGNGRDWLKDRMGARPDRAPADRNPAPRRATQQIPRTAE